MNLRTIGHLAEAFGVPVGLSDHTLGVAVPVAAVALGACIVEKHFTLSRKEPGPDSAFSLEPDELKLMIDSIRVAEKSLGVDQLRDQSHRVREQGVPPIPVRGGRRQGRRGLHETERPLHPARLRARPAPDHGGAGPARGARRGARDAPRLGADLRVAPLGVPAGARQRRRSRSQRISGSQFREEQQLAADLAARERRPSGRSCRGRPLAGRWPARRSTSRCRSRPGPPA